MERPVAYDRRRVGARAERSVEVDPGGSGYPIGLNRVVCRRACAVTVGKPYFVRYGLKELRTHWYATNLFTWS